MHDGRFENRMGLFWLLDGPNGNPRRQYDIVSSDLSVCVFLVPPRQQFILPNQVVEVEGFLLSQAYG